MSGELITIDPSKIEILAEDGENFIFKPEAEEALLELLQTQTLINDTVDQVKSRIGEMGAGINPNFKGVIGDRVRATYRKYGVKYKFQYDKKRELAPFLNTKEWLTIDTDKVTKYHKEVGELPDGIYEPERENKLSISVREE